MDYSKRQKTSNQRNTTSDKTQTRRIPTSRSQSTKSDTKPIPNGYGRAKSRNASAQSRSETDRLSQEIRHNMEMRDPNQRNTANRKNTGMAQSRNRQAATGSRGASDSSTARARRHSQATGRYKAVSGNTTRSQNNPRANTSAVKNGGRSNGQKNNNYVPPRKRPPQGTSRRTRDTSGINRAPAIPPRKKHGLSPFALKLLIALVVGIIIVFALIFFNLTHNLNPNLRADAARYGISSSALEVAAKHRIVNVLLFGVDGREDVEGERSDSMMILSADFEHGGLKVTSLMRDTYVEIPDNGDDKLNSAYSLGGPELSVKTVNHNFDTAITDYVTIDFTCLVAMVNAVGGVEVNIESDEELEWINAYLNDVNDKVKTNSPYVQGTGKQVLDGSQALAYCRIRYVGNGDFDRTQRQRNVLEQVVRKVLNLNPLSQLALMNQVMPYVKTSLTTNEIYKLGFNVILLRNRNLTQKQIPEETHLQTDFVGEESYVIPDTLTDNIKALYNFIYQIDYTPSSSAQQISDKIQGLLVY